VFFDDFKVEHIKSPVVQMDDYYPFGLTFNSYQRENSVKQRYKFQGQEHIDDLDLGWDSFKWRNHQPDIGRFFNIDPLAEKYYYNSPYAFSENKVVAHIELEGLESVSIEMVSPAARVRAEYKKMDDQVVISPVANPVISSEFGPREAPLPGASTNHPGIDIVKANSAETAGTDVVAPLNGKITAITSGADGNGAGNRVSITADKDGKVHKFFHLQDGFAEGLTAGGEISRGTKIGEIGSTGNSTAPHLHYEVRQNGTALDPRVENTGLTNAPTRAQVNSNNANNNNNTNNTNDPNYVRYGPNL
jgi:RHS repeat-associated protein